MKALRLEIRLYDYWHAGTGRGSGPVVMAEVARTPAGLPYLPGRTVKGLLREGVQQAEESALEEVPAGTAERLFGKPPKLLERLPVGDLPDRAPEEGLIRVSDATLGQAYEEWTRQEPGAAESLFEELAATAIDEDGQAKPKTLRVIEVAVPVTLTAEIHLPEGDPEAPRQLAAGLAFVRGLGTQRRRGLGRAALTLAESD